ncbi:MAG TPA: hypothetical protein VGQ53_08260, partial [Chitinophagaceae bacterium]|nr:hypothetical protein [Chitinophagaceae bacterium]
KPFILLIACPLFIADSSNDAQETAVVETKQLSGIPSSVTTNQTSADDITGFWKLKLEAYDDNGNKILDEAERKGGIKNNYSFRFNADGSCKIVESFKGRYEVKTESRSKMLYVYRNRVEGQEKQDPVPDVYRIISMSKTELVLLENEGNLTFWVFERIS